MQTGDFEAFRSRLMERHTNALTSAFSTVGDVLWLASIPAGLATRNLRVFVGVFLAGTAVATGAHLFQRGTVKEELTSVLRHPIWATRAEATRVFGR